MAFFREEHNYHTYISLLANNVISKGVKTKMPLINNVLINNRLAQFLPEIQNAQLERVENLSNPETNSNKIFLQNINSQEQLQQVDCPSFYYQQLLQTEVAIKDWLICYLSNLLLLNYQEINIHLPFEYYGITALQALGLICAMELWLGRRFSVELVYQYPTVQVLAQHLAQKV